MVGMSLCGVGATKKAPHKARPWKVTLMDNVYVKRVLFDV
jgi:hypothetical protein